MAVSLSLGRLVQATVHGCGSRALLLISWLPWCMEQQPAASQQTPDSLLQLLQVLRQVQAYIAPR